MNENDVVETLLNMSTHDYLLVFTNKGKVFRLKGFMLPSGSRTSKGIPIINLINLEKDDKVQALVADSPNEDAKYLFLRQRKVSSNVHLFQNLSQYVRMVRLPSY